MQPAQTYVEPQSRTSFRRPGHHDDCYRIWAEGPILRIDALGIWDMAAARAYCSAIRTRIADMRRVHPPLRVIIDRRGVPVFEAGVAELLMATYRDVLRAGDRIAMVVESCVAKGNIRRIADREETQAFLSMSTAQTWVLAYG